MRQCWVAAGSREGGKGGRGLLQALHVVRACAWAAGFIGVRAPHIANMEHALSPHHRATCPHACSELLRVVAAPASSYFYNSAIRWVLEAWVVGAQSPVYRDVRVPIAPDVHTMLRCPWGVRHVVMPAVCTNGCAPPLFTSIPPQEQASCWEVSSRPTCQAHIYARTHTYTHTCARAQAGCRAAGAQGQYAEPAAAPVLCLFAPHSQGRRPSSGEQALFWWLYTMARAPGCRVRGQASTFAPVHSLPCVPRGLDACMLPGFPLYISFTSCSG